MKLLHRLSTCLTLSLVWLAFSPACLPLSAQAAATCNTTNCTTTAEEEPERTDGERAAAIVSEFLARHRNFITCPQNAAAMTAYLEAHNLSPLDETSFEKAFRDLRKQGQLKLQTK